VGASDLPDITTNIQYRQENYQKAQSAEDAVTLVQIVTRATTALGGAQDTVETDPGAGADSVLKRETIPCQTSGALHGEHLLEFELSKEVGQGVDGY
jgi:hypothetical protein